MICPRCSSDIKYKERGGNNCPNCKKQFAFEPKTHPLLITDKYFLKVTEKLSDNGKLFYTPQQLQTALSRKKIGAKGTMIGIVILAIITSILSAVFYSPILVFVIPFWVIATLVQLFYFSKFVSLPQTIQQFEDSVVYRWKSVYGDFPKKLIMEKPDRSYAGLNLCGILFCETEDTANFILANQLNIKFGLKIINDPNSKLPENLPIYVLHNATSEGIEFLENVKKNFGQGHKIIDLGLRPQSVMNSKLMKFRQQNYAKTNFGSLNPAEIKWLKKGFYIPLSAMRPAQLIKYLDKRFERNSKQITADDSEKKAQAIGFMTWAGD